MIRTDQTRRGVWYWVMGFYIDNCCDKKLMAKDRDTMLGVRRKMVGSTEAPGWEAVPC